MKTRFRTISFKFICTFLLLLLSLSNAHAVSVSGQITCPEFDSGSEGMIYIGVFDGEDADPENMLASTLLAALGPYTIDMGGNPPANVIVAAFYDANNSSVHDDDIFDWPELGDALGVSQVAVGTTNITGIDIDIATTYAGTGTYELYDDFSNTSGLFDTDKWWGSLEQIRQVRNKKLFSGIRSTGARERNVARINTTDPITQLKADVMVESISDGQDGGSEVFARIDTMLYNTSSASPGDAVGDIWSGLYLEKRDGKLGFSARIAQSRDSQGNDWKGIYNGSLDIPGGAKENTWYKLEIIYDHSANSVTFNVYDAVGGILNTLVADDLPSYAGSSYLPSNAQLTTGISTHDNSPELCHVFAQFDDVYFNFNVVAHDEFSGTALDPLKWVSTEIVKVMENNSAVIMADSRGARETVKLHTYIPLAHTAVDVQIDSASLISVGSKGEFRLEGNFYNDEHGLGSGQDYDGEKGEVWAKIFIERIYDTVTETYSMLAGYYMGKALVPHVTDYATQWVELVYKTFDGFSIVAGKPYRLSINFTGRQMVYMVTDIDADVSRTLIYDIPGPAYESGDPYRGLASRVYANSGTGGKMIARCDQVLIGTIIDSDTDNISDFDEIRRLFNPYGGDMDDDGIMDGNEDKNINGKVDFNETDPANPDTDGDGIKDGIEIGLTDAQLPVYALDFIADQDPSTTTNPLDPDTDRDGLSDGDEDSNKNGRVDIGESDPNKGVTISGRVVDANSAGIPGLWVHAFDNGCGGNGLGGARTDSDGYYTMVNMPAGSVYIEACSRCDDLMYTSEWWTGTGNPGSSQCSDAQNLNIQPDEDRISIDFELEPAGAVSGRILDIDNNPIAGLWLHAFDTACGGTWLGGAGTDTDGYYTIFGMPVGDVYIEVCPNCDNMMYVNEWYDGGDGTRDCNQAAGIPIVAGETTILDDAVLQTAEEISGIVTGEGVAGMYMNVFDWNSDEHLGSMMITQEGAFTLSGLAPPPSGFYRVSMDSGDTYYMWEEYQSQVTPGQTDIHFTPLKGGRITGNVTGDGQNLFNVCVNADGINCGPHINGRGTDDNGNYSFVVPAGTYALHADAGCNPGLNFIREYWTEEGGDSNCANADEVTVILEADTQKDFDLEPAGSVSGRILDIDNDPIAGLWMHAFDTACGGTWLGGARTDDEGIYTIFGMPAGDVYIEACPNCDNMMYVNEWYDGDGGTRDCNQAVGIPITTGEITILDDAVLQTAEEIFGSIAGTGVAGIYMNAFDWDSGEHLGSMMITEEGPFTLSGLAPPPSGKYRISLDSGDTHYLWEEYQGQVTPGQINVNFTPVKGARIYGDVLGNGVGLDNICIHASIIQCGQFLLGSGHTDDGSYSFVVPAGTIYLWANTDCSPSSNYLSQYWTSSGGSYNCDGAEAIVVAAETNTMINFDLPKMIEVHGIVTESQTNTDVPNATIEILPVDESGRYYSVSTDSQGRYSVFVDEGSYFIMAYAPGLAREFYDNVYPSSEASPVELILSDTDRQIDFSLDAGGSIAGTIYESDGVTPVPNAEIFVTPSKYFFDRGYRTLTDVSGHYVVDSLALGLYKVTVRADGFEQLKFYDDIYGWHNAENVLVHPPAQTMGIDIKLGPEARISGYIKATDSELPLALGVTADTITGNFEGIGGQADIENSGNYTIKGLPAGTYTLRVGSDLDYYVGEFYDNAYLGNTASTVSVLPGDHITDINFDLEKGGQISGRIVDDVTGEPIREVQVGASSTSGGGGLPSAPGVDNNGYFSLNVMPGFYKINVFHTHGYIPEYYQNAYTFDNAFPIEVQDQTTTPLIEIRLEKGGSIKGHVYTEDGITPLAGASLYAFPVVSDMPGSGTISGFDGSYTIEGLPSGKYVVKAVTTGFTMQSKEADVIVPAATLGVNINLKPYPYTVATVFERIIAPSGGVISIGNEDSGFNGVAVEIQNGALTEYTLISISELDSEIVPMPQVLTGINIPVHLGPEGIQFNVPVTLQVKYTDQDLLDAGVVDAVDLDVFTLNTKTFKWEKVEGSKIVDYVHKQIEIELKHFSIYQLGHSSAAEGDFDLDNDVDGSDIAEYIQRLSNGGPSIALDDLAGNFGQ